jgi:D-alanyl-D-alanine carboxypeptidase/D-alanyl-D-alanine-endopeptidase (penicillin-binding protein 4)
LLLLQVGVISSQYIATRSVAVPGSSTPASVATEGPGTGEQLQPTTEELGLRAMSSLLGELSPCSGDVLLEEGAGLARRDLVPAASIVALLSWMSHHKCADIFRESLPVAGMDGTLRGRMKNTLAASNVRAKTGTLKFVNALSGYATTAAGERLAFSILLNNYSPSDGSDPASSSLDSILGMLVSFTGHS